MEDIAPSYRAIVEVKYLLGNGTSLRDSLSIYIDRVDDEFSLKISKLVLAVSRDQSPNLVINSEESLYRRSILHLFASGLNGEPVLERLEELEKEVKWSCDQEIEQFIQLLPVKTMIPVLILQVPAFLLLLFGPILTSFVESIQ